MLESKDPHLFYSKSQGNVSYVTPSCKNIISYGCMANPSSVKVVIFRYHWRGKNLKD